MAGHDGHDAGDPPVWDEAFWEQLYGERETIWSGRPNAQLVAQVSDLPPGAALDVGCGEGGDAIWLASRGWRVTAVDISPTALRRARAHAEQAGPEVAARITWQHADLTAPDAPDLPVHDLVTAHFIHLPPALRVPFHQRLAAAVAPGGTLLVVVHGPEHMRAHSQGERLQLVQTADETADLLEAGSWQVQVCGEVARQVVDAEGVESTNVDAVLKAQRTDGPARASARPGGRTG